MSKFLKWFSCGLCAVFVVAVCAQANAAIILSGSTAFTPGTTDTYAGGPADYVSLRDPYNNGDGTGAALVQTTVPQGGYTTGLGPPWNVGLMELWRPTTGTTHGSPNDHGFDLETIHVPLAGNGPDLTVTVSVARVTLTTTGAYTDSNATLTIDSIVDTGTFTHSPALGARMYQFNVGAPSESIALDQTYVTYFEWTATATDTSGANNNSLVWYRFTTADPNGYSWRKGSTASGWVTLGASGGAHPRPLAMALNAVPEPSTLVLMGLASVPALVLLARRRRKC